MNKALEVSQPKEFVSCLPQGIESAVVQGGKNFSGGQRQRLALARALLFDTPIYIFDEATSNIDMESEEMIMNVIRELSKTKMILFISHRLSNVVDSDCIYMMKDGIVAEEGTHEHLVHTSIYLISRRNWNLMLQICHGMSL